jgi:predicted ester cyclase
MDQERNKAICREVLDRAFNQGDVTVFDEYMDPDGVDYQEPQGTDFIMHLKTVVQRMRTAFPDLNFEINDMLSEGDRVAFRCTMTGTHTGVWDMHLGPVIPPTGRRVSVPHLYIVRIQDGKTADLWHQWDLPMMLQQLGVSAGSPPQGR